MTVLDLALARGSYVWLPMPLLSVSCGIERIATDIDRQGIRVMWDDQATVAGEAYLRDRLIIVAGWVSLCPPWVLRFLLSHELAHFHVGFDEDRVRDWQRTRYGDLVDPPEWEA